MESYLKTAAPEDGSIYKLVSRNNKKVNKVIPPLLGPTGLQYSTKDKSNLIANSLQNQFTNNRTPCNDFHTDRVISCVQDFFSQPPDNYIPPHTSPQEIQEIPPLYLPHTFPLHSTSLLPSAIGSKRTNRNACSRPHPPSSTTATLPTLSTPHFPTD
ncbi:hypothetical protein NPIL_618581 [Nephila pilipes]|uniref:Uncharacterized protein n=1 Tax=Nephila pilipes TaxID=299642 RepID=A0A8X6PPY5_NEPPI|nr:hypothetical protein NPIL_618581 [Nephila pilipes]